MVYRADVITRPLVPHGLELALGVARDVLALEGILLVCEPLAATCRDFALEEADFVEVNTQRHARTSSLLLRLFDLRAMGEGGSEGGRGRGGGIRPKHRQGLPDPDPDL